MTQSLVRSIVAAATVFAAISGVSLSTQAQGGFTQPTFSRIYTITPRCRANPDYPVVGRVAGYVSGARSSRLSWVGCFPNMAQCEQWRYIARGAVNPPIQHNTCEPRF